MTTDSILSSAPDSDKSLGFLNDIFGVGWQNAISGTTPAGGSSTVLYELFYSFNAVVLAGVTVLLFYVISAGVVGTAHEGESLGKRYSTLWTPIRSALAISFLMPLPWVKMSMLQALVLKFVFLSIGGADFLANQAVDAMVKQGGAVSPPRAGMPNAEYLGKQILGSLVIQEYYIEREGATERGLVEKSDNKIKGFTFEAPYGALALRPYMGKFSITCADGVQSGDLCDAELNASVQLVSDLRPVAQAIVSQWSGGANVPMDDAQVQLYRAALTKYTYASQQAETEALAEIGSSAELDKFAQAIKNNGWAWLGTFYSKIAKNNETAQEKVHVKLAVTVPPNEYAIASLSGVEIMSALQRYHGFVEKIDAGRVEQQLLANSSPDEHGVGSVWQSFFRDGISSAFGTDTARSGGAWLIANTLSNGDTISNLQKLGHSCINAGSNMYFIAAGAGLVGKAVSVAASTIPGGATLMKPVLSVTSDVLKSVSGALYLLVGALFLAGFFLAFYIPALPFILFTAGVISWLLLVLETVVAASLWAASHAVPEGEGMAGQHAKQGYMLFLGVLMRPSLHVIGFFLSFVVANIIGHFVGEAYLDYTMTNGAEDKLSGLGSPFAWISTVGIGAAFAIYCVHKSFALITVLPDKIMSWIGQGLGMSESDDPAQKAGATVTAFVGRVGGVSGGIHNAASSAVQQLGADKPGKPNPSTLSQGDKS